MAKIIFTWELGSGYGHLLRLLPLAIELKNRGHEAFFILRNLERVEQLFGSYGFQIFQAPLWQATAKGMPEIVSYADILLRYGYFDTSGLTSLVKSWQNYFRLLQPDLIIFDHSPTALLASHGADVPRIILGNGFEIPPDMTPFPAIRWWQKTPEKRLLDHEQKVLNKINQVQKNLDEKPLESLTQLFEVDEKILATFQELDQYPSREEGLFSGITLSNNIGISPVWPINSGKKVFVYLNPGYHSLENLMRSLDALDCCVLAHCPGLSDSKIKQLENANIKFSNQAVNIDLVGRQSELVICHSGIGTGTAMLLSGCPVLLLPTQLEQYTAAKRIVELGAGLMTDPDYKKINFKPILKQLLNNSKFTKAAETFASKYSDFNAQLMIKTLADTCEKYIKIGKTS